MRSNRLARLISALLALSVAGCLISCGTSCKAAESVHDPSAHSNDTPVSREDSLAAMPYREIVKRYYDGRFYLGIANHASKIGKLSTEIADREFGYITPSNDFKQTYIHPTFGTWRWEAPDSYVAHARQSGQVLRMHSPISPQCSAWVKNDDRTPEELSRMLEEYLTGLCGRYAGVPEILWMDVVNETICKHQMKDDVFGDVPEGGWFSAREGDDKWENPWTLIGVDEDSEMKVPLYIDKAFEITNRLAPGVKQIINQDGFFEDFVWEKMKALVAYLRARGRRVDGLGWQAHIETGWEKENGVLERLDSFISWCHANNLEFHVTEMNVWIKDGDASREQEQADTFAAVLNVVLKHCKDGVVGVNFWNVRDEDTSNKDWLGCIWRNDGTPRPAYESIKRVLINNIN